jgi:hypothetical protein
VPTINLADDELAAVAAAIRGVIEGDKVRTPRAWIRFVRREGSSRRRRGLPPPRTPRRWPNGRAGSHVEAAMQPESEGMGPRAWERARGKRAWSNYRATSWRCYSSQVGRRGETWAAVAAKGTKAQKIGLKEQAKRWAGAYPMARRRRSRWELLQRRRQGWPWS